MPELRHIAPAQRACRDTVRLAEVAGSQDGIISRPQLQAAGVSGSAISRWAAAGRLHRVHPGIYALGHAALSLQGRLTAALLYAGPGAVFSHTTAAWIWSLTDAEPNRIHLAVKGRRGSLPAVRIHGARHLESTTHRGLPITSVPWTLLDLASIFPPARLRRVLAEADFRGLLDPAQVKAVLGRGRPGSAALRRALGQHMPELAQTLSVLEERFLVLCEASGLPLPEVNVSVAGMVVDAIWRRARVVVELDGAAAHGGWAAIKRDRQRELGLRSRGFVVLRYTWEQVSERADEVVADLRRALAY
jgi:Transcriptional regulator, AbiEi antitoxin/Protein of unknown function (DUF559)